MAIGSARPPEALAEGALRDVFNPSDPVNTLTRTACGAAQALPPVAGNQVSSVICALKVAKYAYRTTYLMPSGTKMVRITSALAGVPTPIDVNGDGVPDFTGMLAPTSTLNGLTLDIARLPTTPADWKVIVEAVAAYPAAPNTFVGFGEDGMTAGTEGQFGATATLLSDSAAGTEVKLAIHNANPLPAGVTVQQSLATTPSTPVPGVVARVAVNAPDARPTSLAVLGELFSGSNPDAPTNVSRGDVSFASVPADLTTDVKLTPTGLDTTVTSSAPSTALAHVNLISPGDEKDIDATVDQIPTSAEVVYTNANDHSKVIYTAAPGSVPIRNVSVLYHDLVSSSIVSAAAVDATSVPNQLSIDQVGPQTSLVATGGAIGSLEGRYGLGVDVPPRGVGTDPYISYHRSEAGTTAGVRLINLQSLTVNASNPYTGDLVFSTPLSKVALSAVDDIAGLTFSGSMTNLPAHTSITADAHGTASFDGHGAGIDEIVLDATSSTPVLGGATHVHSDLIGVPASFQFRIHQYPRSVIGTKVTPAYLSAVIDNPVKQIDFAADEGPNAVTVPGADAGLAYVDVPGNYAFAGRVFGLKAIVFQRDPLYADVQTEAGHVFNVLAAMQQDNGQDIRAAGVIDKLPSDIAIGLDRTGGTTVDYSASSRIDRIELALEAGPGDGLVGNAHFIYGKVLGLPRALHVEIAKQPVPAGSPLFTFCAATACPAPSGQGDSIDRIQFQALADASQARLLFPQPTGAPSADADGLVYHNLLNPDGTPKDFSLGLQLAGLRGAKVIPDPLHASLDIDSTKARAFGVDVQMQTPPGGLVSVACASEQLCVAGDAVGNDLISNFPSRGPWIATKIEDAKLVAPACPTTRDQTNSPQTPVCVRGDNKGNVLVSRSPTLGSWKTLHVDGTNTITGASCVSASLCLVVDNAGNVLTSTDPADSARPWTARKIDTNPFVGVSCTPAPSDLCTAIDSAGNAMVTTDAGALVPSWATMLVDSTQTLRSVSCPSTSLCVAVDGTGAAVSTTSPGSVAPWQSTPIDPGNTLSGVSCPTALLCVAVDQSGNILTSNGPAVPSATVWASHSFDPGNQFSGVGCAVAFVGLECAAVDNLGDIYFSTDPSNASWKLVQSGIPVVFYRGYVDKPVPGMDFALTHDAQTHMHYSAGAPMADVVLDTNTLEPAIPFMHLRLQHVPTMLNVCFATGDSDSVGCIRPRPGGYPPPTGFTTDQKVPNADGPNNESVDQSRLIDAKHILAVDIDDAGTATDSTPLTVDAYLCFVGPCSASGPAPTSDPLSSASRKAAFKDAWRYAQISNLRIRNFALDVSADSCNDTGGDFLFCGHISLDTRGLPLSGLLQYVDHSKLQHTAGTSDDPEGLWAGLNFPDGFTATDRYVNWHHTPFTTTSGTGPLGSWGSVYCPPNTGFAAQALDSFENYASQLLCA